MRSRLVTVLIAAAIAPTASAAAAPSSFYLPPVPLPQGAPGDVIRSEPVRVASLPGARAWRVLYRSTTATGEPTAVSGMVITPRRLRPGAPLVGIAPGFPGMADRCAPSRTLPGSASSETPLMLPLLQRGYALAVTDYEGLGTPGDHRYVVGASEAHAVLDAMRAARQLPGAKIDATQRAAVSGYSQGGHAAMMTAELQPEYAPDVPLEGVAAGGLPADFEALGRSIDGGWFSPLLIAVATAYDAAYPELHLDEFLTARGRAARAETRNDCLSDMLMSRWIFTRQSKLTVRDPLADPAWQRRFRENRAAQRRPPMPLLLYHSRADQGLAFGQAEEAKDRYCALGATVRWRAYIRTEHALGFLYAIPRTVRWLDARLRGEPEDGNCATG